MKRYNELKTTLTEMEDTPMGGDARSAMSDYGVHRIEDPEQLSRLNAFLNAVSSREFLDPKGALFQIKNKLNMAGYDFECNPQEKSYEGMKEYPVNRHGGTFGKSTDTPFDEFERTDGISNSENSYSLKVNTEKLPSGLYKMSPSISPTSSE
jgi:hypothetical protein